MNDKLVNVLEAIIFASGKPIEVTDILSKMPEVSKKQIEQAINELLIKYSMNSGVVLLYINGTLQMVSNSKYGEIVTDVLLLTKEKELSKALLETLAIIAYKRMVTKQELEDYRGTNCDYTVMKLSQLNLIEIVGRRDSPGKPNLYSTTNEFLKKFGLNSLDDLPSNEEIQNRIKIINEGFNSTSSDELFDERKIDLSQVKYDNDKDITIEENESYKRVLSDLNSKIKISKRLKEFDVNDPLGNRADEIAATRQELVDDDLDDEYE